MKKNLLYFEDKFDIYQLLQDEENGQYLVRFTPKEGELKQTLQSKHKTLEKALDDLDALWVQGERLWC